jgi:thiol-disulfide isomerase/thioredoxin
VSEKDEKPTSQSSPYLIPLAIIVAGGLVGAGLYFGGRKPATPVAPVTEQVEQGQPDEQGEVAGEEVPQYETTVGDFKVLGGEVCQENGKPIVYYFGSSGCPHCQWEYPIIQEVMAKFADQISFHDLMDKQEEMDVFQKYIDINGGGIPFIVLGCRYVRVGSGEGAGEETEKQVLTQLLCQLTNNQPSQVCP